MHGGLARGRSFLPWSSHEHLPVLTSVQDGIGTITLNRPEARNALNQAMRPALAAAVAQMRDDAQVHTVILTGAGGAFCSGGDISQMMDASQAGLPWRQRMRSLHQWFPELVNLEKPVIAAVDGPAFGAGLSLALAADFVLCTRRAKFCAVFGRIGLVPDLGAMHMLPRIVGLQRPRSWSSPRAPCRPRKPGRWAWSTRSWKTARPCRPPPWRWRGASGRHPQPPSAWPRRP